MFVDHPGPQSASSNRIVLRLRAYSDAFLGQPRDLSGGDKIILHQSVLNDIMNMVIVFLFLFLFFILILNVLGNRLVMETPLIRQYFASRIYNIIE